MRKSAYALLALLLLAIVILAAWYQVDGQPRPEATAFLTGDGYQSRQFPDGSFTFTPATPNGHGLLIMHGALIKPLSYARSAAYFAQRGYTVFLPSGSLRLSILAVDGAAARLRAFGVRDWFFIGHSMGGFASLTLLRDHAVNVRAVALWAAAMPGDFSGLRVPMLFLWGDRDGLLPPERLADTRSKLPAATRYLTLPGGNHQDFAMYTHQFFDNPGSLGWEQQIGRANEATAAFFFLYHSDRINPYIGSSHYLTLLSELCFHSIEENFHAEKIGDVASRFRSRCSTVDANGCCQRGG